MLIITRKSANEETLDKVQPTYPIVKLIKAIQKPVRTGRTPSIREINHDDDEIHFIKTNTLRNGRIEFDRCDFLPKRVIKKSDWIIKNEVIVTIIGATHDIVGRAAIRRERDPYSVTNQNVAVIRTNQDLNPFFLTAYLLTNFGRNQLWRHSRQTEQVNLNCREVERIRIPIPPLALQYKIGKLIDQSFELQNQSKSLYAQAEELLDIELGLDKFKINKPAGYEINLSKMVMNKRMDGEYFQPQFKALKQLISNYKGGFEPFLKNINSIKPNIDPKNSPDLVYQYIELADINTSVGIVNDTQEIVGKNAPGRARRTVEIGDILASAVVGSVDKAALIGINEKGCLASTGFFHFRSRIIQPGYLLILIRSKAVSMQLLQEATGGILSAVPEPNLKKLMIPIINSELQNEINALVKSSHESFKESENLLNNAKQRVENMIEEAIEK